MNRKEREDSMDRHRRRRRRRYGDPVISMPSFGAGAEYNPLNKHVNSTDVLVGAGIGVAGGGLVGYGLKKFWPTAPRPNPGADEDIGGVHVLVQGVVQARELHRCPRRRWYRRRGGWARRY